MVDLSKVGSSWVELSGVELSFENVLVGKMDLSRLELVKSSSDDIVAMVYESWLHYGRAEKEFEF